MTLSSQGIRYAGQSAILFGGARGIGAATALRLASEGARVMVCDLRVTDGECIAAEASAATAGSLFRMVDVADAAAVTAAVDEAAERFGRLDLLFNNVGIVRYGLPHELSLDDWDMTMAVNIRAQFTACRAALQHMLDAKRGVIINTASVLAHGSQKNTVAYSTSKAAVLGLTRTIAIEYARAGIRCVSISPGSIDTPILREAARSFGPDIDATLATWADAHPVGRLGTKEEVAGLIAYLGSDEAGFITGMDYAIDGGVRAELYN